MKTKKIIASLFVLGIFNFSISQNTWMAKQNLTGTARNAAIAFSIGNKGYVGIGDNGSAVAVSNDFWEWN